MTLADVEFNTRGPMSEADEIIECLRTLIMTPAGTVPLDRDFGISQAPLDRPLDIAENLLAVEIIDKARKYEPRAAIREVRLTANMEGKITVKVAIANA